PTSSAAPPASGADWPSSASAATRRPGSSPTAPWPSWPWPTPGPSCNRHTSGRTLPGMAAFTVDALQEAVDGAGLRLPRHVIEQVVAAIQTGKNLVLTGPPGTGKTTLAYLTAEVGHRALMCTGYLPTTATTEWTTFETIGGL